MVGRAITVGHIQHDFEQCIAEDAGQVSQFYINVDKTLNEIQEFVIRKLPDDKVFDAGRGNAFAKIENHVYRAILDGTQYEFCTMDQDFTPNLISDGKDADWTAIGAALLPERRYALGDSSGGIKVYDACLDLQRKFIGAHAGEITSLKFLTSGDVLLSSSTDARIKLWSLLDGSNPRTFDGHKGAVTDLSVIERGRNFLSSSTDGTVRLWECGSGQNIHSFTRKENPNDGINKLDLVSKCASAESTAARPLEFGTEGKQVLAGHESGVVTFHDIFAREQLLQLPSKHMSSCNALKADLEDKNYVYVGYQNGLLAQWDLRQPKSEVDCIAINEGTPINDIFLHSNYIYVSSGIDTSLRLNIGTSGRRIRADSPTFLVANDYQVSQFILDPQDKKTILIGNWGFCAKYGEA